MTVRFKVDSESGEKYLATSRKGKEILLDPFTNKGTAFSPEELAALELEGLVPRATGGIEKQLERCYEAYSQKGSPLEKFIYLASLQDRNETLFFRLVHDHIDGMMPIVYTPTVGEACQRFSHIHRRARGLYVSYDQRGRIETLLRNFRVDPAVIVVTDGERILGLGDQGAGGMGICIGKLCLYTLCAGVSPYRTLPIALDVGTDNEERLADPLYLGLCQKRVRGEAYQAFVDEFVAAVEKVFPEVLLQWEDFLKGNAIAQLERFRDELCTFNDDIQGTASVVLAGVYSALRITGQRFREQRVVIAGAGASAQGIADLLVSAFEEDGLSRTDARRRIWTLDSRGLVTDSRPRLEDFKATYARPAEEVASWDCADRGRIGLEEVVRNARPTLLIGTSAQPGLFDESVLRAMGDVAERPIVFPLSNPTSKSECTAEEAIRWTGGRAIVATGSPFDAVRFGERRYRIGQANNAFIFPGIGLGAWAGGATRVTDRMFLAAAKALAGRLHDSDLAEVALYPELSRIRECSHAVACAAIEAAVADGHADPKVLEGLEDTVHRAMWFPEYVPIRYEPDP